MARRGKAKQKSVFNPFERMTKYTALPPSDEAAVVAAAEAFPAEFLDTSLSVFPPLPQVPVSLTIKFRCTVSLLRGDTVLIYLPTFRNKAAQVFTLGTPMHVETIRVSDHFLAYWSGETKLRKRGMVGIPPKQVLLLRCVFPLEENVLVHFTVPLTMGLISPDKLLANATKIKIEGRAIRRAEGGVIARQSFLAVSEVRRCAIPDELQLYEVLMHKIVQKSKIRKEDGTLVEALAFEEVDQLQQAVRRRRPYPVAAGWAIWPRLLYEYHDAKRFAWAAAEGAVAFAKRADPLALHAEVAANWGLKPAALLVLEDLLVLHHGAAYPGLSRAALLALHLLTMSPAEVAGCFSTTTPPSQPIFRELQSAGRMLETLPAITTTAATSEEIDKETPNDNEKEKEVEGLAGEVRPSYAAGIFRKWAALIAVLMTATMVVSGGGGGTAARTTEEDARPVAVDNNGGRWGAGETGDDNPHNDNDNDNNNNDNDGDPTPVAQSSPSSETTPSPRSGGSKSATRFTPIPQVISSDSRAERRRGRDSREEAPISILLPPPPLYVGVRDVPAEELQALQSLELGSWYIFTGFVIARQRAPIPLPRERAREGSSEGEGEAASERSKAAARRHRSQAAEQTYGKRKSTLPKPPSLPPRKLSETEDLDDMAFGSRSSEAVPDNAIVFELRGVNETLELAELSTNPYNREWLLPLGASFRIRSVESLGRLNDVLHVVLEMHGSLAGAVSDPLIPEPDCAVTRMVAKKVKMETENAEAYTTAMAQLIYLNIRLQDRRRLHPPTRMRAEYQQQYQDVERGSRAKLTIEEAKVVWQVCVSPTQMLEEGVVKPSVWEAVPKKYATTIEFLFLGRSNSRMTLESNGLVVNLADCTADYAGKGPRPLRRLVNKHITYEATFPKTYAQLVASVESTARQLDSLNAKLNFLQSSSARKRSSISSTAKPATVKK